MGFLQKGVTATRRANEHDMIISPHSTIDSICFRFFGFSLTTADPQKNTLFTSQKVGTSANYNDSSEMTAPLFSLNTLHSRHTWAALTKNIDLDLTDLFILFTFLSTTPVFVPPATVTVPVFTEGRAASGRGVSEAR